MLRTLKKIRKDFQAVFERDPAARRGFCGGIEVILTYSGFHAALSHRICHFLHKKLKLFFISRLISQFTKFITGIEIHPGAEIEEGFFIDHGMGVVIGETTEISKNVTLYQGVTLGGTGKERGKRHPTLEENVVIGAGAKVLGNIIIGRNTNVGAGSVVVKSVPPGSTVVGVPGVVVRQEGKRVRGIRLDHTNLPDPIAEKIAWLQKEIDSIEDHISSYHKESKTEEKQREK
jgi:serine O-acetyltransferase